MTGRGTRLTRPEELIGVAAVWTDPPHDFKEVRRIKWGTGIVVGFSWGVVFASFLERET